MAAMTMNLDMVGERSQPSERGWLPRDCTLYALSVGAGFDDLAFVGEKASGHPQQVLSQLCVLRGPVGQGQHRRQPHVSDTATTKSIN